MLSAVIFDMDGVLIDSEPLGFEAMRLVMASHGVRYTEVENTEFLGKTTLESCRVLRARHAIGTDASALARRYTGFKVGMIRQDPRPRPGVPGMVQRVGELGFRLALASSAAPEEIAAATEALGLGRAFNVVVAGTEVEHGKPAPDIFVEAGRRLRAPAGECLVIEDSRNGLLAAKAAGMRCAIVPCPATRHQSFAEADFHFETLESLPPLLMELGSPPAGRDSR
jgi:HAD superfamily hydrolase (TIGR01509 family)